MTIGSKVRDIAANTSSSRRRITACDGLFEGTANHQYVSMTEAEFEAFAAAKRKAMAEGKE